MLFAVSLYAKPVYVVTAHPLYAILSEITAGAADIKVILPAGGSPHTFSPKPSTAHLASDALALFYVSPELDGWATTFGTKTKIKMMDFLPNQMRLNYAEEHKGHEHEGHSSNGTDPHFWTDPLAVKAIVPGLCETLCKLDPPNAKNYRSNAGKFEKRLDDLNKMISEKLKPFAGKYLFSFHPSFCYLIQRYGLVYGGSIEPSPGKEPSVRFISELTKKLKKTKTKAIFTEPQLPDKPAKAIAEAIGIKLWMLDPIGGVKGRFSYFEIINYNTDIIIKAL